MKKTIITVSIIAAILILMGLFVYFAASGKTFFSAVSQENGKVEVNTNIPCDLTQDCLKADNTLPATVYCKDSTCRFLDTDQKVVFP
jgi:hypothetical protein